MGGRERNRTVAQQAAAEEQMLLVAGSAALVARFGFDERTDDWWFRQKGVATIHLSTGLHSDYHKPSDDKPVMITVVVDDPDAWYDHFQKKGVATLNEPHDDVELNLRIFLLKDPEGYVIEIQKFY